jgi:hypothetical protein
VVPLLSDSLFNATSARDLTTLYYLFYQGNSSSNWTPTTATAFQLLCWKIVSDPGNYNLTAVSPNFYVPSWSNNPGALTLASSWLTTVSGTTVPSNGSTQPVALTHPTYQDLLFTQEVQQELVPFGMEAWSGAGVLGLLAFWRLRNTLACPA